MFQEDRSLKCHPVWKSAFLAMYRMVWAALLMNPFRDFVRTATDFVVVGWRSWKHAKQSSRCGMWLMNCMQLRS
jgi:hypothetical protein